MSLSDRPEQPGEFQRLVIIGAGAVGGVLAVDAARAGRDVVLVESDAEHREAIAHRGLRLRDLTSDETVPLPVVAEPRAVDFVPGDAAIIAVKAGDTDAACAMLAVAAGPSLPVFCPQNGVRNDAIAARHFEDVNGMVILFNGKRVAPGEVIQTLDGRNEIGTHPEGVGLSAERMLATMAATSLTFEPTTELSVARWNKLLLNLANPIGALLDLPAHEVRNGPDTRRLTVAVYSEGERVLLAAGIDYEEESSGEVGFRHRLQQIANPTWAAPEPADPEMLGYTSMWQDLARRSGRSEVEYLTGELVRLGEEHGVPTPYNSAMLELVRDAVERRLGVGGWSIAQLLATVERRRPDQASA